MKKSGNSRKTNYMKNIAEILGILDEKSLSKDWLLGEIKRHKIKTRALVSLNTFEILKSCQPKTIEKIFAILKDEDLAIRDVKTLTKTLHWFFIDIIDSSDPNLSVKSQARKINALNVLIQRTDTVKKENLESLIILPTGDGMAIGFQDSPEKPLRLAIELHKALRKFNKSQKEKDWIIIRIGIDTGPVYFMKGIGGGEIFWGPGIIMARRVMDLCGPNQIIASERIAKDLRSLSEENKATMNPIRDKYRIKHGEQLTIYNIFGKDFGNKKIPKTGKISKIKEDEFRKLDYEFDSAEIKLDVTDIKSMATHHTWIWHVRNISKEPLDTMYYNVAGDTDKEFEELNLKISDEKNNQLVVSSREINKLREKEFYVKFKTPLKKSQKGRFLKLEYDWDEPDRNFIYGIPTKCKKFKFTFTAPKKLELKSRMLQKIGGKKRRVDGIPKIKYTKDRVEFSWESPKKYKIEVNDEFEFQW